jgi:hypothetical protein
MQIKKNKNILSITISNTERKIQHADDTSVILDGSEQSLLEPLITLQSFSKMSGLLKLFKNSYRMD